MNLYKVLLIPTVLLASIGLAMGQEKGLLSKDQAVKLALEFNYDIKVAKNNVLIAENNADIKNNNYLPTVSLDGVSRYNYNTVRQSGDGLAFAASGYQINFNSSVNVNYTIFDGMGRKYTFERNKNDFVLSELQARQVIEGAVLQLIFAYYEVARLSENEISQLQTLQVSKERLQRAKYGYDYGQSTQLDVLNAEVDVNTDSINYLTIVQELENAKRDLNLLMGREVNLDFDVDTLVNYEQDVDIDLIISEASKKNVNILQADNRIQSSEYDVGVSRSGMIPKVGVSAGYGFNRNQFDPSSPLATTNTTTPNVGINLSWNIFDGGATSTRVQNARITRANQEVLKDQAIQQLYRDLNNAWTVYQTAIFVLDAQKKNLETNQRNFDRTVEQNRLGQVTNIEFRQAQLNFLNARLSYNQAKYSAKNAELALLQLSGNLLNTDF